MHRITVVFGSSGTQFFYSDRANAERAFDSLEAAKKAQGTTVSIADEYGQRACLDVAAIHGYVLENLEESKLAHIELGLHQARMQAKANEMGRVDPVLRTAAMHQGGMPILSPQGNGRFS